MELEEIGGDLKIVEVEWIDSTPKLIRGKPRKNKWRQRSSNKRGLLPHPPPNNPDPLTLIPCPNCSKSKFEKSRGDLLYNHLITCLKEETLLWNCPLCKIEVIIPSQSKPDLDQCLRFVEHLNTCHANQAPHSSKEEDEGPYPLSSRLFQCDLCYPLQNGPSFIFPHFLDHCKFHKSNLKIKLTN